MRFTVPTECPVIDAGTELTNRVQDPQFLDTETVMYNCKGGTLKCVHKYIRQHNFYETFEYEVRVYMKLDGSAYVPRFYGAVADEGWIRGFLREWIDGPRVMDILTEMSEEDRVHVTYGFLRGLLDFERRGVYLGRLDLGKVIWKALSKGIFFIDFGKGDAYDAECTGLDGVQLGVECAGQECLYLFGRILKDELWSTEVSMITTVPEEIHQIVEACLNRKYDKVEDLVVVLAISAD